ncbi:MAG TPA: transposase [Leptospiraceae bacterium]|nr:transposase [Leptospiraceae bacterium]HMY32221.1 transposase [Leptospiraceae bacterium]HMZ67433.1 transposase [Leptospiraceae bacterium]HNA10444.1 transposase [Leptospiraceae bacterium]HNC56251.1 transposase [Leptospiraceae bacterium]
MQERKLNRLSGYDYSTAGYYFITSCVKNRECLLGEIFNSKMDLNEFGKIVNTCWLDLPNHYKNIQLDEFVIMPNHFHGIIYIMGNGDVIDVGNGFKPFPTLAMKPFPTGKNQGLPEIVRGFKTFSSRRINETNPNQKFQWQKSYHDRIIRNERELFLIRRYIRNNPMNWMKDKHYI